MKELASRMIRGSRLIAVTALALPAALTAQVGIISNAPIPAHVDESQLAGARLMRSGVASQFDSLGMAPLGHVGDTVTSYLFGYDDVLSRVVHSRISTRQRFQPPVSWRAACDEVAHPGWFYKLTPASTALFAVVIPGVFGRPTIRPVSDVARAGVWQFFHATADSAYQAYVAFRKPASVYASDYMHNDFWGSDNDARFGKLRMFGVVGPGGRQYTALTFALRDDYPNTPNTMRTWIVDSWGYPVASLPSNIDLYGTVDDGGIDAVLTSSGLIRWDGTQWRMPRVYSEEPCLYHRTMPLPAGAHP
jgi:hypothetical protein